MFVSFRIVHLLWIVPFLVVFFSFFFFFKQKTAYEIPISDWSSDVCSSDLTLGRRIKAMAAWLENPQLLEPDADADYAAVIDIDLADIHEPIVACPNDPDDVKTLSEVAGTAIDEVFIGSCMTNIGHFRAASKLLEGKRDIPSKLWVAPPTKMDQKQLTEEEIGRAHV